MPASGLPAPAPRDIDLVVQALEAISPRWNAWVLMSLTEPARYSDLKARMPWMADGQLHPKVRDLQAAGLVRRTEHTRRHVIYTLTDRGAALLPVLDHFAAWGSKHLERPTVKDPVTKKNTTRPAAKAEEIEDALHLISRRHATTILWALRDRGATTGAALASSVLVDAHPTAVYHPLKHLSDKRLVTRDHEGKFVLTAAGRGLTPAYEALTAWATGQPTARRAPARPAAVPTRHTSQTAIAGAVLRTAPAVASWKSGDLFSHPSVARPVKAMVPPAGGVRR
ncbi:winged helix-turn-helix transcriptional regulator [Streptomyces sp. NBC_00853]|uniref:winged helix-turn-helix transcriptional regulator n=1 Tax=Streptomyces sp. NBC_00853 TaxID=2903681 RepID=UPI0038737F7D|nr:winged helix-turn-helix transcriptional regulator [Streptomyces sp. NBC_00853]